MINRLPKAVELADKLKRYGGLFNILIHPNILGQKLEFEQKFVKAMGDTVWYGTMSQFGDWWSARDRVAVEISRQSGRTTVSLSAPNPISGLTLDVPASLSFVSSTPALHVTQSKNHVVILDRLSGNATLEFKQTGT